MNIRDEEQLQQYFERQMTSGQEQNFLINVAARDDMRLAFRSQLELLKAVREDKDASGSPTFVRSKTLGALGLAGSLVPSSLKEHEAEEAIIAPTILQKIGTAFRRPVISLATGLLAGILGTSFFLNPSSTVITTQPGKVTTPSVSAPVIRENIPAPAVQTEDKTTKSDNTNKAVHEIHKAQTAQETTKAADNKTPVVNVNSAGKIHNTNTISKPENSSNQK